MILFSVNGKCGYPLKDTFAERYNGLDGRHSKLFVDLKSSNIALRFELLPYKGWTRQIRTSNRRRNREDITLAKLSTHVARRMHIFFEEVRDEVVDLSYQRYPGVIDLDHLEGGGVCKHSYMAHFRLNSLSQ